MIATIYSYDTLGNQIFMIAVGPVVGDQAVLDVFITVGGLWGDLFDPALVMESQWGTGTLTGINCESINMELNPNAEFQALDYHDLTYLLIRLVAPIFPCPFP